MTIFFFFSISSVDHINVSSFLNMSAAKKAKIEGERVLRWQRVWHMLVMEVFELDSTHPPVECSVYSRFLILKMQLYPARRVDACFCITLC
jgi:hypothetical protein